MGYLMPQPSEARGAAVAAPAALTSAAPAALTAAAAAGGTPTKTEFDKVVADNVVARTEQAALQADIAALRTSLAALRTSLINGAVLQP